MRFNGYADFKQVHRELATLTAETNALQTAMSKASYSGTAQTNANSFRQQAQLARSMQSIYADAAASTGLFDVSTRKVKSHTDEWIKSVQRQKMSARELFSDLKTYRSAFNEQMRLQQLSMASFHTDARGNPLATIAVPKQAIHDAATLRQHLGFAAHAAESVSTQMINAGKNMQWSGRQLSMGITLPLVAAGAASAKFAFQVDKELTSVAKVYDTYAQDQMGQERELQSLREDSLKLAKYAAKEYGMAADQTINIMSQLASTGQRGAALQENTKQTARFAVLGDFDPNSAVNATNTLKAVFGIQNDELAKAVDFMNNIENSTSLTMEDMAAAIPTASAAVKQLNGSYKDMLVLLTAMKERGFDPGESANALKAAGTRLGRPSKKVQEEFRSITGQDILEIRDRNEGDLVKTLTDIGNATKNLGVVQRNQALVALFGTEQAARLGATMNGLTDAQKGVGQTAIAMEVAQMSAADNAALASKEMQRQADSVSGRWTRAVETLKVQFFEFGETFLEMATTAVEGGTKLIDFFNSLPGGVKKLAILGIAAAGIAGPLIMLGGLFTNLGGQFLKGTALGVKFATQFKLVNTEQAVAAKAAEWANQKLKGETDAVKALTLQLEALTNSLREAAAAEAAFNNPGGSPLAPGVSPQSRYKTVDKNGRKLQGGAAAYQRNVVLQNEWYTPNPGASSASPMQGFDIMAGNERSLRNQNRWLTLNKAAMGAGAVAMTAQMVSSNKVTDNIAKWTMIGSLVVPMVNTLAQRVSIVGKLAKFPFTPWGAAITATTIGVGFLIKKIRQTRREVDEMYNDTSKLEKAFNLDPKKTRFSQDKPDTFIERSIAQDEARRKQAEKYANVVGDAYPKLIDRIKDADTAQEKYNIALEKGLQVYARYGDADKAKAVTQAALDAAEGVNAAGKIAAEMGVDWGDPDKIKNQVARQARAMATEVQKASKQVGDAAEFNNAPFTELPHDALQKAKASGNMIGLALAAGINEEGPKGVKTFKELDATFKSLLDSTRGDSDAQEQVIKNMLKGYQVTGKAADRVIDKLKEQEGGLRNVTSAYQVLEAAGQRINAATVLDFEFGIKGATAKDIESIAETFNRAFAAADGNNLQKEQAALDAVRIKLLELGGTASDVAPILSKIFGGLNNVMPFANFGGFGNLANDVRRLGVDSQQAAAQVEKMNDSAQKIMDESSSAATNTFAANAGSQLKANYDAHLASLESQSKALQDGFERRQQAMEDRQKAAQDRFDDRQKAAQYRFEDGQKRVAEAQEARWKRRKRSMEDEENLRKRIFDAEKNRIQRMKELNNDNVDYRVAVSTGNLDQAAKIRNEIDAKKNTWALEDSDSQQAARFDANMQRVNDAEERDKARLDRTQELQKRAFDRKQELDKRAFDRAQDLQRRALDGEKNAAQRSIEIAKNAAQKGYEAQKKGLDAALKYIKDQNPKTQAELNKAIAEAEAKFGKFGGLLNRNARSWAKNMTDELTTRTIRAMKEISGVDWSKSGKSMAGKFMKGVAGDGLTVNDLVAYMRTGKLPKKAATKATKGASTGGAAGFGHGARHTGGPVGRGVKITDGSRKGYPGSAAPFPSERFILAKNDEFLMTGKAVRKFGADNLHAMNMDAARHTGGLVGAPAAAMTRTAVQGAMSGAYSRAIRAIKNDMSDTAARAGTGNASGDPWSGASKNGWQRPWKHPYGTNNGHDWPLSYAPIFAPHDGRIVAKSIPGYESRRAHGGFGFRSYGRYTEFTGGGANIMFAHLSKQAHSGKVKRGDYIGTSGETGNTMGPHVHMELNHGGNNSGVNEFFAKRGIALKTGGTIKYDDTPALLHADERVLSAPLSSDLDRGLDRLANGDSSEYNEYVNIYLGQNVDEKSARLLAKEIDRERAKKQKRYSRGEG